MFDSCPRAFHAPSDTGACAISPTLQVFRHGREQEPVIVIDDFAADPERLVEDAAQLSYGAIGANFPGVRARVPPALAGAIVTRLEGLIHTVFGIAPGRLNRMECYYSLITTPPGALAPIQRFPHFDGLGGQRIAVLHHLGRAGPSATAFYRHRSTGFETMSAERLEAYNQAVNRELRTHGLPPAAYLDGDTPLFERIAAYEARFNRVLVYRGHALHAAELPPGASLAADPRTGRFSINGFLWLEP